MAEIFCLGLEIYMDFHGLNVGIKSFLEPVLRNIEKILQPSPVRFEPRTSGSAS